MAERSKGGVLLSRRRLALLGGAATMLLISACQVPGTGAPPRRIRLLAAKDFPPNLPSVAWTLLVKEPDATLALNTARITYIRKNGDITYLSTGEWSSRAPEMVMELLVESFKNSGKMLSVGDRRARIRPDFELDSDLIDFQIEETRNDAGVVRVELLGRLVKKPRRNVISSFPFDAETAVEPMTLDNIIDGFQTALADVLEQAVEWTLRTGAL